MKNQRVVVSGQVLDGQGNRVSGARVFVRTAPGHVPALVQDVALLTGDDGLFKLSLPGLGLYELACYSDLWGTTSAMVEVGASDTTLLLQFPRASQP